MLKRNHENDYPACKFHDHNQVNSLPCQLGANNFGVGGFGRYCAVSFFLPRENARGEDRKFSRLCAPATPPIPAGLIAIRKSDSRQLSVEAFEELFRGACKL
jgi:hypothetical protein